MSEAGTVHPDHLLTQARAGDRTSLGRLLEMFRGYLMVLARCRIDFRLKSKVDPADLVQETFLEAARDFGQFRGSTEQELMGWLRRILVTNFANLLRRYVGTQSRDPRLEVDLAAEFEHSSLVLDRGLLSPQSSPSQVASRREQAVLLAEALEGLPPDYREVLLLRNLQGRSFPEVALAMKRSVDSVEKLWTRALVRLRRLMGESA